MNSRSATPSEAQGRVIERPWDLAVNPTVEFVLTRMKVLVPLIQLLENVEGLYTSNVARHQKLCRPRMEGTLQLLQNSKKIEYVNFKEKVYRTSTIFINKFCENMY